MGDGLWALRYGLSAIDYEPSLDGESHDHLTVHYGPPRPSEGEAGANATVVCGVGDG